MALGLYDLSVPSAEDRTVTEIYIQDFVRKRWDLYFEKHPFHPLFFLCFSPSSFLFTCKSRTMPPSKDDPRPNPLAEPSGSDYYTHTVHNDTYPAISPLSANLSGKSVIVCGASRGIGKAIALSYARAGANQIAIGARSDLTAVGKEIEAAAKEAKRTIPKVLPLGLDVTSKESVAKAAEEVKKVFGKVDILINNAGILGRPGLVGDVDVDDWYVALLTLYFSFHLPSLGSLLFDHDHPCPVVHTRCRTHDKTKHTENSPQVEHLDGQPPRPLSRHPGLHSAHASLLVGSHYQCVERRRAHYQAGVFSLSVIETRAGPLRRLSASRVRCSGNHSYQHPSGQRED